MKRNRGVILTCKVGARMPMKHKAKPKRPTRFLSYRLESGPYAGAILRHAEGSDLKTLVFRCKGMVGQYYGANWIAAR